jgi:hypothetical protein
MESFNHLAQNEDWLADEYDELIHSQDAPQYEVFGVTRFCVIGHV